MKAEISIKILRDLVGPDRSVEFTELYRATNLLPHAPRFSFGTFPDSLAQFYYRQHHLGAIGVYRLRRVEVFGPYGVARDGDLICCPEANIHEAHVAELFNGVDLHDLSKRRRFLTGPVAHLAGPGYKVYGHWLSDFLPKLYLLQAAGNNLRQMRYLVPGDTPHFGFKWLDLLGIPAENRVVYDPNSEVVWCEELHLPTTLHNGVRASILMSDAAILLRRMAVEHPNEIPENRRNRRIFLSRSQAPQTRPLQNREEIERIAVRAGLEIVHPQTHALVDQIGLFESASLIVGEYGSAMHGSLFSPPGTIVCALRGSLLHPGFIQSGMGYALGQPTGYVFGATDETDPNGPFSVPESAFSCCLEVLNRMAGLE